MTTRDSRYDDPSVKRRSVLKSLGAGAGVAGIGGLSTTVSADGGDKPEIGMAVVGAQPGVTGRYRPGDDDISDEEFCREVCVEWHWSLDSFEVHCNRRELCCTWPRCPDEATPPFGDIDGPLGGGPIIIGAIPVSEGESGVHLGDALGDEHVLTVDGQLQATSLEPHLDHVEAFDIETGDDDLNGRSPVAVSIPYSGSGYGLLTVILADSETDGRTAEYVVGRAVHVADEELDERIYTIEGDGELEEHTFEWFVLDEFDPEEDPEPLVVTLGNSDYDPGYDTPCHLPGVHHPDCDNWEFDEEIPIVPGFSGSRYHT